MAAGGEGSAGGAARPFLSAGGGRGARWARPLAWR